MPQGTKIIFDHRQKTAGTSVQSLFRAMVGAERVSPLLLEGTAVLAHRLLNDFDIVCGHFDPEYNFPRDVYHMTILREPIERFLSQISYLHEVSDNDRISNYLRNTPLVHIIDRGTRFLDASFWNHYTYHFAADGDRHPDALIGRAQQVLDDRFQLVGITERLPDTVRLLCHDLNWSTDYVIPHERPSRQRLQRKDLEPAQVEKLKSLMAMDFIVYEHARESFLDRLSKIEPNGARTKSCSRRSRKIRGRTKAAGRGVSGDGCGGGGIHPAITLVRAESYGLQTATNWPHRGEIADIAFQIKSDMDLDRVDFRVRIYNDFHLLMYEEYFASQLLDLKAEQSCEFGIKFPLILGIGLHFADLTLYPVDELKGRPPPINFPRCCEFVVERDPSVNSTGLVALAAQPYVRRDIADDAFGAKLVLVEQVSRAACGTIGTAKLALLNTGSAALETFGVHRTTLGYRIRDRNTGELLSGEPPRTSLRADIPSGGFRLIEASFTAPALSGDYLIEWDLVREWSKWFGLQCTAPLEGYAGEWA